MSAFGFVGIFIGPTPLAAGFTLPDRWLAPRGKQAKAGKGGKGAKGAIALAPAGAATPTGAAMPEPAPPPVVKEDGRPDR